MVAVARRSYPILACGMSESRVRKQGAAARVLALLARVLLDLLLAKGDLSLKLEQEGTSATDGET